MPNERQPEAPNPIAPPEQIGRITLRVLATGDLHAHLTSFDYYKNSVCDIHGLTRIASLIREARAQEPNCLLFDNGDLLQGSVLGDVAAQNWKTEHWEAECRKKGQSHPAVAALNALKTDAATLGNHDFNFGLDFLRNALDGAQYPVVSANLATELGNTPQADHHLLPPYVILDREVADATGKRHPIRIGVLGVLPPQTILWDYKHLHGKAVARGIAETVQAFVPEMRAEGADLIVVLAHTGFSDIDDPHCPKSEHAALAVARVSGIDLMIAGHTHHAFPSHDLPAQTDIDPARGTVAGTPTMMSGQHGSHLSVADLNLVRADGRWLVTGARTEARPIFRRNRTHEIEVLVADDPEIKALLEPAHQATIEHMSKVVGVSAQPLHSYFSLLGADAALQVVAEAQSQHIRTALAGTRHEGLPIISAVAPFRAGGRGGPEAFTEIPSGPVTRADIANLYLYPNICSALRLTGAQVAEWLEQCAGIFHQIEPGRKNQTLLDPAVPSYNFDVLYGLTYKIDLSQPARYTADGHRAHSTARRIRDLKFNGRAIDPTENLIVVSNDYRASGAGNFTGASRENVIYDAPCSTRELLYARFAAEARYDPVLTEVWRFRAMPNTSVILQTSPRAVEFLPELAQLAVSPIGLDEAGFLRLAVAL